MTTTTVSAFRLTPTRRAALAYLAACDAGERPVQQVRAHHWTAATDALRASGLIRPVATTWAEECGPTLTDAGRAALV